MTGWNESTLRGAASWKAFKDGKAWFESGAVTSAKSTDAGWSGAVREGKRIFKVAVKVLSPTNIEARCGCPENQSSGAVCAHAVAAGLAALSPASPVVGKVESSRPAAPLQSVAAREVPKVIPVAYSIALPINWMESIRRGKLSVTLVPGGEMSPADERLAEWLAEAGINQAGSLPLNLDGELCDTFLTAIADHPRIEVRKTGAKISIRDSSIYQMEAPVRKGETVVLKGERELFSIGTGWYEIFEHEIVSIGPLKRPGWLVWLLERVSGNAFLELPIRKFLQEIALWQEWVEFGSAEWLEEIQFVPASPSFEMVIDGTMERLEATIRVSYGSSSVVSLGLGEVEDLPRLEGSRCEVRNWAAEKDLAAKLHRNGFESIDSSAWRLMGEVSVTRFLGSGISSLSENIKIAGSDRFNRLKSQIVFVEPRIEIRGEGDDWLRFDLSFQSNDGSRFDPAEIRNLLRGRGVKDGRKIIVSDEASSDIQSLLSELDVRQEDGGFVASKLSGEVIRNLYENIGNKQNNSHLHANDELLNLSMIQAQLRSYQTSGAGWLLNRVSSYGGALLADDMGLGKTLQAIACINELVGSGEGAVVIVATTSLLGNWQAELRRFAPHLSVRMLHGNRREMEQSQVRSGDILLTTYGTLPRDLAWYLNQKFRAIVLDEASLMRNPDTDHAKAISRLKADARIALTGTPIENGVRDLWSIFRFIQPGWLGSRESFKQGYEGHSDDPKVIGRLRLKISPFMLRRTKEEVAPELPSKIMIEEICELTADQQSVYRELLREGRKQVEDMEDAKNRGAARMRMLTVLLRLRQACCDLALFESERFKRLPLIKRSAKLQRLMELLNEAVSGGHKVLVFSQFQKQLQEIEHCLREAEIPSLRLDGQTRNRQELVDRFQEPTGPPVFLISLKAGGYGLNLTAADIVIHFDPWWNPAAEAQATDRAHRIGQTRPVTVYRLIAKGTVEEKVVGMQEKKRRIAVAIDDSGESDAAGWSERDLMELLE